MYIQLALVFCCFGFSLFVLFSGVASLLLFLCPPAFVPQRVAAMAAVPARAMDASQASRRATLDAARQRAAALAARKTAALAMPAGEGEGDRAPIASSSSTRRDDDSGGQHGIATESASAGGRVTVAECGRDAESHMPPAGGSSRAEEASGTQGARATPLAKIARADGSLEHAESTAHGSGPAPSPPQQDAEAGKERGHALPDVALLGPPPPLPCDDDGSETEPEEPPSATASPRDRSASEHSSTPAEPHAADEVAAAKPVLLASAAESEGGREREDGATPPEEAEATTHGQDNLRTECSEGSELRAAEGSVAGPLPVLARNASESRMPDSTAENTVEAAASRPHSDASEALPPKSPLPHDVQPDVALARAPDENKPTDAEASSPQQQQQQQQQPSASVRDWSAEAHSVAAPGPLPAALLATALDAVTQLTLPVHAAVLLKSAQRALETRGAHDKGVLIAATQLAGQLRGQQQLPQALTLCRALVALREETNGPQSLETASALLDLGECLRKLKEYAEAETAFARAVAVRRVRCGSVHPQMGSALNAYGVLLQEQGKSAEAASVLKEAFAIFSQVRMRAKVGRFESQFLLRSLLPALCVFWSAFLFPSICLLLFKYLSLFLCLSLCICASCFSLALYFPLALPLSCLLVFASYSPLPPLLCLPSLSLTPSFFPFLLHLFIPLAFSRPNSRRCA